MKSLLTTFVLATALMSGMPAQAQNNLDFTLLNKTGYTISEVYVSKVSTDDWEEDVMGQDVLDDGERVAISFPSGTKGCLWDLQVVYDDEEAAVWSGFDLCSVSTIVLRYDRADGRTWAEYE